MPLYVLYLLITHEVAGVKRISPLSDLYPPKTVCGGHFDNGLQT